ncbi:pseudouridine synthase [Candidatus Kryptonium thompsonii]|uniref:pseudouridine synthase n=1 Tax=Candidatus Kryptonium thompsonii TaxID=1633631 RepID=UPI0007077B50|nr:pseudouridine synthase [Candidatus Kryptonium thompsoni]CUS94093.1 pseudouridine synthase [Candidatus Kryptonium thompsoni]
MKKGVSLERALSKLGYMSRSIARKIIIQGKVSVNSKIITDPSFRVDLKRDKIAIDGETLKQKEKIYIVLNKPKGVITTRKDELNRKTAYDILKLNTWVAPVGRLDKDTSGLLILTNDNKFADFITNPESKVPKTYIVKLNKKITPEDLIKLQLGMEIEVDNQIYKTMPAKVRLIKTNPKTCWVEIEIVEGKNRQIRRMFEKLGYKVGKIVHEKYEDIQEHFGTITTVAQENIAGIRVIKSYVREDYEVEKFRKLNFDYMLKNIKLIKVQSLTYPLMILITGISIILVVWYGGYQVIKGAMTLGQITSFLIYLGYLIWPMIAFGWIVNLTQRASASMDRLLEVFKVEPQIKDTNETDFSIKEISGEIKFKNVWFKYPDSESYVLKGINLEIKQGQTVGIVGYTGSGKTTLVNLIPRLFDPDKGEVLIDGINVKKIPLKVLRESIGYVQQEVFLFSDSVKNNITFGVDGVSDEEVFNVAKIAHIYDEVIEFPNGFDTIVGERGITLSGGQRQRVGLARALIKKPKILILDDSLSSVDAYTEEMILKSLKEFRAGRTTIIISHRITAVKDADFIIVLDDGEIVEQGTHDELLELGGIYADLYQKQILEEELERM